MKKQIIGVFLVVGVLVSANSFADEKENEILINYLLEKNKQLEERLATLEKVIKVDKDGITTIKANEIVVLNKKSKKGQIKLFVEQSKPTILLFDKNNKIRSGYFLRENGTGEIAFRSKTNKSEIVITNSPEWGIKQPNFLRRPNDGELVEAVFK